MTLDAYFMTPDEMADEVAGLLERQKAEKCTVAELLGSDDVLIGLLEAGPGDYLSRALDERDELDKLHDHADVKPWPLSNDLRGLALVALNREVWRHDTTLRWYAHLYGLVPVLVAMHATFGRHGDERVLEMVQASQADEGLCVVTSGDYQVMYFDQPIRSATRPALARKAAALMQSVADIGTSDTAPPWEHQDRVADHGEQFWDLYRRFTEQGVTDAAVRAWNALVERVEATVAVPAVLDTAGVVDLRGRGRRPHRWVVEGLVVRGELCVLAGPAFVGKTVLMTDVAASVATGRPVLGRQVSTGRVLYATREAFSDESVLAAVEMLGHDLEAVSERLLVVRHPSWPGLDTPEGGAALAAYVRAFGLFELVVVDTARTFVDGDENASATWGDFMTHTMDPLRRSGDAPAVVLIDHTAAEDSARPRGSTAKLDVADVVWMMQRTTGEAGAPVVGFVLVHGGRYRIARPDRVTFERRFDGAGRCAHCAAESGRGLGRPAPAP